MRLSVLEGLREREGKARSRQIAGMCDGKVG